MTYNTPDEAWNSIYGYDSFDTYVDKCVVKGLFHKVVHEDIQESFKVAEYIMAFSFYHYPMYDEAISKVLLIVEMAIKIRCESIGITLHKKQGINSKKISFEKKLHELITEYGNIEPEKKLEDQLTSARNLRNSKMHPKSYGFAGLLSKNYIIHSVSLINKIFLDKSILKQFDDHLEHTKKSLTGFKGTLSVLEHNKLRYLVSTIDVVTCVSVNNEWIYLLAADPVVTNKEESLKNHSYAQPLVFSVNTFVETVDTLICTNIETGDLITIKPDNHPANENTYKLFLESIKNATETDLYLYEHFYLSEIGSKKTMFLYNWLWKV